MCLIESGEMCSYLDSHNFTEGCGHLYSPTHREQAPSTLPLL